MRIPLAFPYGARDADRMADEVSVNAFAETGSTGQTFVMKRSGTALFPYYPPSELEGYNVVAASAYPGAAQGCYQNGNDIYFVRMGRLLYSLATDGGYGDSGAVALGNLNVNTELAYTFIAIPEDTNPKSFFLKSTNDAFRVYDMSMTAVTDPDYPAETVPGAAYLDGTFYVMTPLGYIYGSELEDPLTWSGLNVIKATSMPDDGVAIRRMVNYIVAFGKYTTEFFYDAGNPTGSPLLPVTNAVALVGCSCAESIADTENTLYFMGVTRQQGRSIYRFNGTIPEKISTPAVERVISDSDLSAVFSYFIKMKGHPLYVLTLKDLGVTLVFDALTNFWHEWTSNIPYIPEEG